ncbi:tetratricopeptide repeat protein [Saccharopolyspora sp. MS10]|uniref:tetratricopeptide repeat protein n=1 Tax=Saccharopolyspora sp. MS10 TaxID=3385973 RepID=UPI0039A1A713
MTGRDQRGTGTVVARPVLDDALHAAARNRVCLVIAAAGWGKTTAVREWAAGAGTVTTWWAPEGSGDDAGRLLTALREAAAPHLSDPAPAADRDALCSWLRGLPLDLHLVVDDLHECGEHATALLADLCRTAPPRLRLVLLSRQEPPFSLERLRGQGKVSEIDAGMLAFSAEEIAELAGLLLGEADRTLAQELSAHTGGWPAAVCRAIDSLRSVPEQRRSGIPPAARFHPYLAEEVLDREPEPSRHALHRLAVLGETAPEEDTGSTFLDLARRGLLRPGDTGRWALVPPLAEFFAAPRAVTPELRTGLHRQAAEEQRRAGRPERALRHLVAAREAGRCADLLAEAGDRLLDEGHVDVVLDAATVLGSAGGERVARVLGRAHRLRGRWPEAAACWRRAGSRSDPGLGWRIAEDALARAELEAALAACATAEDGPGDAAERARLFAAAALAHRLLGDLAAGRSAARRSEECAADCPPGSAATAAARLARAVLAEALGDQREARSAWFAAVEDAPAGQLGRSHALRALHRTAAGDPASALGQADAALRIAEQHGDSLLRAHALTQRGDALTRLGRFDEASVAVDGACETFGRFGTGFLAWPLCVRGDVHRRRGRLERARSAYEEALALSESGCEVLGTGAALIGLARVRAVDDPEQARSLAQRAVDLGERLHEVRALLTRGWIAWESGDREGAAADAALAAGQARSRGDEPGLAEALALGAVTSPDPLDHGPALDEAVQIWRDGGFAIEEAQAVLLRHRLGPVRGSSASAELAERTLREHGTSPDARAAAGPLAAVARLAPPVTLRALGVFRIEHAGVPVPRAAWQSRKARELLKILVVKRRPVRREELMELLWPETDPTRAGNRLSVLLSTVRDVLALPGPVPGSVLLTSEAGTIGLDPRHVRVDVESFLAQADRALAADRGELPGALDGLLDAAAAYTGDLLEDDPYHGWADALADELRTTHAAVLRALLRRLRAAGDVDRVARFALRLLRDDRYDEEAHLDLVGTLLRAERFGEARRRYELYRERMREISVSPRPFPEVPALRRCDDTAE